jgi:hypothetical protein
MPHPFLGKWKELLQPPTLRPLALVITYFFVLNLGGMSSIRPFMMHVFQGLGLEVMASWIAVSVFYQNDDSNCNATCMFAK